MGSKFTQFILIKGFLFAKSTVWALKIQFEDSFNFTISIRFHPIGYIDYEKTYGRKILCDSEHKKQEIFIT